jgi:sugar phosphate isomerase/epimerase
MTSATTGVTTSERTLTLSHFSMRHASFDERVSAASGAGFDGVGLYVGSYSRALADAPHSQQELDRTMAGSLATGSVALTELEALPFFRDDLLDVFAHLVEVFGAQRVQVVPPFSGAVDRAEAATWLSRAADRLAPARLAIEFLPPTAIPDATAATELVERAGHPAIGLCVDSWHVFRGGGLASLADLDPAHVVGIQIDDGATNPVLDDYIEDCLHHRQLPGDGEFDLATFLAMLPADAPISIEVIDDDLDLLDPDVVASMLMKSMSGLLAPIDH